MNKGARFKVEGVRLKCPYLKPYTINLSLYV